MKSIHFDTRKKAFVLGNTCNVHGDHCCDDRIDYYNHYYNLEFGIACGYHGDSRLGDRRSLGGADGILQDLDDFDIVDHDIHCYLFS